MMRAIDIVALSRNKALLWSVPYGRGHIVATGLNVLSPPKPPAPPKATWSGPAKGTYGRGCPRVSCPAEFPFPTKAPRIYAGNICYDTAEAAATGNGLCGSWCTHNISVGGGCGDNGHRVCAPSTCLTTVANTSACEAECSAHGGCNAVNYNATVGCCLRTCPAAALGPPSVTATPSCCGYWQATVPPPPPVGPATPPEYPEMGWVLDRLLRYASAQLETSRN